MSTWVLMTGGLALAATAFLTAPAALGGFAVPRQGLLVGAEADGFGGVAADGLGPRDGPGEGPAEDLDVLRSAACAAAAGAALGAAGAWADGLRSRRAATRTAKTVACALPKGEDLKVSSDAFVVCGLAHCLEQTREGRPVDVWVLEPVIASAVEVIKNGAATSYEAFIGTTVGQLLARDLSAFPADLLCGHEAKWGENLEFRTVCAARTWMRHHARVFIRDFAPVGKVRTGFNTKQAHPQLRARGWGRPIGSRTRTTSSRR